MHFLDRAAVPAPRCLARYRHGHDKWCALSKHEPHYIEVADALDTLQGARCAYCERALGRAHVDHFEQQSRRPQLTFAWDNLFRSCMNDDSCGRHKDRQKYAPADLIKPDVDDPEHFFRFKSDGSIAVLQGLSAADSKRAHETLRILSLDAERGPLRTARLSHVAGYIQTGLTLLEMAAELGADVQALIDEEVATTAHLPHATAIKHVLTLQGS